MAVHDFPRRLARVDSAREPPQVALGDVIGVDREKLNGTSGVAIPLRWHPPRFTLPRIQDFGRRGGVVLLEIVIPKGREERHAECAVVLFEETSPARGRWIIDAIRIKVVADGEAKGE